MAMTVNDATSMLSQIAQQTISHSDTQDSRVQGGAGRIGINDEGVVFKFNTHLGERLFGQSPTPEMRADCDRLRHVLMEIAQTLIVGEGGNVDLDQNIAAASGPMQKTLDAIRLKLGLNDDDQVTTKRLLDRTVVARVINDIHQAANFFVRNGEGGVDLDSPWRSFSADRIQTVEDSSYAAQSARVVRGAAQARAGVEGVASKPIAASDMPQHVFGDMLGVGGRRDVLNARIAKGRETFEAIRNGMASTSLGEIEYRQKVADLVLYLQMAARANGKVYDRGALTVDDPNGRLMAFFRQGNFAKPRISTHLKQFNLDQYGLGLPRNDPRLGLPNGMGAVLFTEIPAGKLGDVPRFYLKTETYHTEGFVDTAKHLGRLFKKDKVGVKHGEEIPKAATDAFKTFCKDSNVKIQSGDMASLSAMYARIRSVGTAAAERFANEFKTNFGGDMEKRIGDEVILTIDDLRTLPEIT